MLEVKNMVKTFFKGTINEKTALQGIDLRLEEGDFCTVIGGNGAGKSTTISCILGIIAPDSGAVVYEGNNSLKKWKQHIGFVPQELAIYDELTAEENVRFFCALYGGSNLNAKVDKALDFVGLNEVRKKKAGTFSGGMKRRLNLACGIAHEPDLIIMDEPTVGIDPQSRNHILENVKKLHQKGATILYTTHYMPEAEEICDRLVVVDHGQVIASGTKQEIVSMISKTMTTIVTFRDESELISNAADELRTLPGVTEVTVENQTMKIKYLADSPIINSIVELTVKYELIISNITTEEPSLEEIFLSLTGKALRDNA